MDAREHTRSDVCPPLGRVFSSALAELFLRMKWGIHPLLLGVSVGVRLLNVEEKVQPEDGLALTHALSCAAEHHQAEDARTRQCNLRKTNRPTTHILDAKLLIILNKCKY